MRRECEHESYSGLTNDRFKAYLVSCEAILDSHHSSSRFCDLQGTFERFDGPREPELAETTENEGAAYYEISQQFGLH